MSADGKLRLYPLPRPEEDARFTLGLTVDVGAVLVKHGFPPVMNGHDYVRLRQKLFEFIYANQGEKL